MGFWGLGFWGFRGLGFWGLGFRGNRGLELQEGLGFRGLGFRALRNQYTVNAQKHCIEIPCTIPVPRSDFVELTFGSSGLRLPRSWGIEVGMLACGPSDDVEARAWRKLGVLDFLACRV